MCQNLKQTNLGAYKSFIMPVTYCSLKVSYDEIDEIIKLKMNNKPLPEFISNVMVTLLIEILGYFKFL